MAERRDKVREAYTSMGITRKTLAKRTGLAPKTITNAIAGDALSKAAATRIGEVIGWTADEVLRGERIIKREGEDRRQSEHVSPEPLPPVRPANEPLAPPTKDAVQAGAA
jgi:plasmid maintenance system antidote protein VapI